MGLRGAGYHTVGRAIFSHTPMASGRLTLDGQRIAPSSPAEAMANGLSFVSSRRAEDGLAASLEVRENIYLKSGGERQRGARMDSPPERTWRSASRGQALFHQDGWRGRTGRDLIRRQSAEGGPCALDGGPCEAPHSRGADNRRRRRRKGRYLSPTAIIATGRIGRFADLVQFEEVERICHRALVFSRGQVAAEFQATP